MRREEKKTSPASRSRSYSSKDSARLGAGSGKKETRSSASSSRTKSASKNASSRSSNRISSSDVYKEAPSRPARSKTSSRASLPRTSSQKTAVQKKTSSSRGERTSSSNSSNRYRSSRTTGNRGPSVIERFKVMFLNTPLKRRIMRIFVSILLVIFILIMADVVFSFGKIHPRVSIAGVDVGGMTVEQASARLEEQLEPVLHSSSVVVYSNEDAKAKSGNFDAQSLSDGAAASSTAQDEGVNEVTSWEISAETISAQIDGNALARKAYSVGRGARFLSDRLSAWFLGVKVAPELVFDDSLFTSIVEMIDSTIGTPIVEAGLSVNNGVVTATPASNGNLVDTALFSSDLARELLDRDTRDFVVSLSTAPYTIDDSAAAELAASVQAAIDEPIQLVYENNSWTMNASELGACISTRIEGSGKDAALVAFADESKTMSTIEGILGPDVVVKATEARFEHDSDSIWVTESQNGVGPDVGQASSDIQSILFPQEAAGNNKAAETPTRSVTIASRPVEPEFSTGEANARGIVEKISSYTLDYSGSGAKVRNIQLLCDILDGTFIEPETIWSFHNSVGECNAEKGFEAAGAIVEGQYEDQIGGGICMVVTTLFNAVYNSGFPVIERKNHSLYMSSYPEGRDATVSYPSPDFQFKNPTSSWLLITVDYTDSYVTVALWGTDPGYSVRSEVSDWIKTGEYDTKTVEDPNMYTGERYVETYGQNARTITVTRYVTKDGTEVETKTFTSAYKARTEVVHVGTKERSTSSQSNASSGSSDDDNSVNEE